MPDTKTCTVCEGYKMISAFIGPNSEEKEMVECPKCKGKGVIHYMTDEDEQDYHDNYW